MNLRWLKTQSGAIGLPRVHGHSREIDGTQMIDRGLVVSSGETRLVS